MKASEATWLAEETGKVLAEALRPYIKRIEALEVEVKAGHQRLKELEAVREQG
ncbi:hypothetical protein ACFO5X_24310 [Seohaeicola nanhaiensis]|uniref:Uncharacterized protein n=1 Tax=Seohaeicola nanhaiensis TaxID=1387282 RepID=A0ABV9KNE9_9RHOB